MSTMRVKTLVDVVRVLKEITGKGTKQSLKDWAEAGCPAVQKDKDGYDPAPVLGWLYQRDCSRVPKGTWSEKKAEEQYISLVSDRLEREGELLPVIETAAAFEDLATDLHSRMSELVMGMEREFPGCRDLVEEKLHDFLTGFAAEASKLSASARALPERSTA